MRASGGLVDTWLQRQIGKVVVGLGIDNFKWAAWLAALGHSIVAGAIIWLTTVVSSQIAVFMLAVSSLGVMLSLLSDLHLIAGIAKVNDRMINEGQLTVGDVKLLSRVIRIRTVNLVIFFFYALASMSSGADRPAWVAIGLGFLVQIVALHLATSWDSGRTWRERVKEKLSSIQFRPSFKPAVV